jgi:hypothetical protein
MPSVTWNKPETLVRIHNAFRGITMRALPQEYQSCVATQVFSVGMERERHERGAGRGGRKKREKREVRGKRGEEREEKILRVLVILLTFFCSPEVNYNSTVTSPGYGLFV